jgi:hypothetical protein
MLCPDESTATQWVTLPQLIPDSAAKSAVPDVAGQVIPPLMVFMTTALLEGLLAVT